jgi:DNA repair protein RadC
MKKMTKLFQVAELQVQYLPTQVVGSKITIPEDAVLILKDFYDYKTIFLQEQFIVVYLNRALRPIGVYKATTGGINSSIIDVRLVMSVALNVAASSIILSHNHPSGELTPSNTDLQITKKVKKAADLLDIQLTDHIILNGKYDFYSMSSNGDF